MSSPWPTQESDSRPLPLEPRSVSTTSEGRAASAAVEARSVSARVEACPLSAAPAPRGAPQLPRLVVVGNGMVGHRFCERALERGLHARYRIEIFGDEPCPAYDRVNLARVTRGVPAEALLLKPERWYEQQGIVTRRSVTVSGIDRSARELVLSNGTRHGYDRLVLATGARPVLPEVPGKDLPGVVVYRSLADAHEIRRRALAAAGEGARGVVVGAGLLGLELADELVGLGARPLVIESGAHILPRQLDARAAKVLHDNLVAAGLEFRLSCRVGAIRAGKGDRLVVELVGGEEVAAAFVVFAVGIRPRDELARAAGLACDLFGGVEVEASLATSDPHIGAIGDCVRHRGMSYGLVAPGYRMAEVLVERLLGNEAVFEGMEPATRLKTPHVEVFAVGETALDGSGTRSVVYDAAGVYRRLTLRDDRVVGASAVGAWDELAAAEQAVARRARLRAREERRFCSARSVWGAGALSLETWPAHAVVCSCRGISAGAIQNELARGCSTLEGLIARTGASTVCGSCRPLLASATGVPLRASAGAAERWLVWVSTFGVLSLLVWLAVGPIPYATSVQRPGWDALFRDATYKQISGYTLAALMSTSALFSLRKRARRRLPGSFGAWRLAHASVGVATLIGTVAHTGFRLGHNLDAALMVTFLACTLLGVFAGLAVGLERFVPLAQAQRVRTLAGRLHLYLVWPLPLLVVFHALKAYYF